MTHTHTHTHTHTQQQQIHLVPLVVLAALEARGAKAILERIQRPPVRGRPTVQQACDDARLARHLEAVAEFLQRQVVAADALHVIFDGAEGGVQVQLTEPVPVPLPNGNLGPRQLLGLVQAFAVVLVVQLRLLGRRSLCFLRCRLRARVLVALLGRPAPADARVVPPVASAACVLRFAVVAIAVLAGGARVGVVAVAVAAFNTRAHQCPTAHRARARASLRSARSASAAAARARTSCPHPTSPTEAWPSRFATTRHSCSCPRLPPRAPLQRSRQSSGPRGTTGTESALGLGRRTMRSHPAQAQPPTACTKPPSYARTHAQTDRHTHTHTTYTHTIHTLTGRHGRHPPHGWENGSRRGLCSRENKQK